MKLILNELNDLNGTVNVLKNLPYLILTCFIYTIWWLLLLLNIFFLGWVKYILHYVGGSTSGGFHGPLFSGIGSLQFAFCFGGHSDNVRCSRTKPAIRPSQCTSLRCRWRYLRPVKSIGVVGCQQCQFQYLWLAHTE